MNRTMITRGKIALARVAARLLLQVTGLEGETFNNIELLLPPGYVANPDGGDVVLAEANGVRSHVVALAGDNTADTVADLQPGESGLSRLGVKTVLLRANSITVADPARIILQAPLLQWTPDGITFYELATAVHVHGGVQTGGGETAPPLAATGALTG